MKIVKILKPVVIFIGYLIFIKQNYVLYSYITFFVSPYKLDTENRNRFIILIDTVTINPNDMLYFANNN